MPEVLDTCLAIALGVTFSQALCAAICPRMGWERAFLDAIAEICPPVTVVLGLRVVRGLAVYISCECLALWDGD